MFFFTSGPQVTILPEIVCTKILKPTNYNLIPNEEDRLFIGEHFLALFEKKGYEI